MKGMDQEPPGMCIIERNGPGTPLECLIMKGMDQEPPGMSINERNGSE